jgi:hypothetical protein
VDLLLILAMTVVAALLLGANLVHSGRTNLYSAKNLFLVVWFYYGFSIGLDLFFEAELSYKPGEANLTDYANYDVLVFIMSQYMLCGAAFLLAYTLRRSVSANDIVDRTFDFRLPPLWFIVLLHILALGTFVHFFWGMDRMARLALTQQSPLYKLVCLIVPITHVLDILIIMRGNKSQARAAWGMAILLGLVTGNRSDVLLLFLVALFRWRPPIGGWRLMGSTAACGITLYTLKTIYAMLFAWSGGEPFSWDLLVGSLPGSLSSLDASASYLISAFYLGQDSPLWLGRSYVEIPLMLTWPRFLGGYDVSTLSETYVATYQTMMAERGGSMAFSAIAEAWLNFSYLGAPLLGFAWGLAAHCFDKRPRGVAFYIFLFMTARLFRSDFATLYKNWIVVWGTLFVVSIAGLVVYSLIFDEHSRRLWAGRRSAADRRQWV